MRKIVSFLFVLTLLFNLTAVFVSAQTVTKDGLKAELVLSDDELSADKELDVRLTVKNVTKKKIKNIRAEILIPDGFSVVSGKNPQNPFDLASGKEKTVKITLKYDPSKPETTVPASTAGNNTTTANKTTTTVKPSSVNNNPQTFDAGTAVPVAVLILSVAAIVLIVVKSKYRINGIISFFVCFILVGSLLLPICVSADSSGKQITLSESFKYNGKNKTVKAVVSIGENTEASSTVSADTTVNKGNTNNESTADTEDSKDTESIKPEDTTKLPDTDETSRPLPETTQKEPETTAPVVVTAEYSINVTSITGKPFSGIGVNVYTDGTMSELVCTLNADGQGSVSFIAEESSKYVAVISDIPEIFDVKAYYPLSVGQNNIVLDSVLPELDSLDGASFKLGDLICDYTFTDCNGNDHTVSDILMEKDALVLNFWFLNCQPCKKEFPFMQQAYLDYADKLEIIAVNPVDGTDSSIAAFADENSLTFPMAVGEFYWQPAMDISGYPTTVVINRNGVIAMMHKGSITKKETFTTFFEYFTSPDYAGEIINGISDIH